MVPFTNWMSGVNFIHVALSPQPPNCDFLELLFITSRGLIEETKGEMLWHQGHTETR
jgi:hypothetical protein